MLDYFLMYNSDSFAYVLINISFFRFFSIVGYYKILNTLPVLYSRSLLFILNKVECVY